MKSMDSLCHGENSSLVSHAMDMLSVCGNALQEPEQLGSVTHNQEVTGSSTSLQIRSSARVSKKMRLDSFGTPVTSVVPDKKELTKVEEKPEKLERPEKLEKSEKHEKADPKQNETKPRKRTWELWSQEDKNTFFEALNEYGKDFDSIQNHFATKARKKGLGEHLIKNKDQVRHFYYRTWHKISKHLKFSDDLKNAARELYGLVNYGEIRRKIGFCTEKIMCMKLNELVYKGTIQIRIKGKTLRIKTPLCRALRKLNRLQECQEDLKLPARVVVELRPRHNEAWSRVQAMSHNPRIRTVLPLQRRLTSLLVYLNYRWRPSHIKHRDKLLSSVGSTDLTPQDSEDNKKEKEPLLRVAPHLGAPICVPSVNVTDYMTSSSLCLSSYAERSQKWQEEATSSSFTIGKGGGKGCTSRKGGKRQRVDSSSDKKSPTETSVMTSPVKQKENVCPESEFVSCGVMLDSACDDNKSVFTSSALNHDEDGDHVISGADGDLNNMAVNDILPQHHLTDDDAGNWNPGTVLAVDTEVTPVQSEVLDSKGDVTAQTSTAVEPKVTDNEDIISRIRNGWTIEDAHAISIGELYLMFGGDSKLQMEYWWEHVPPETAPDTMPLQVNIEGEIASELQNSSVGETLQKLISIAKLNFTKAKVMCPCGHVCGVTSKSTIPIRRPPPVRSVVDEIVSGSRPSAQQVHPAVSVSVTAVQDGVFRRPLLAPSHFKPLSKPVTADAFKAQLDKFRPRYCNRRGRAVRPKNVVVQRMLPLLPKAPNGHAMVTLKVIPQTSQLSGEFMPIGTAVTTAPQQPQSQPAPLWPHPMKNYHILPATTNKSNTGCLLVSCSNTSGLSDLGQDVIPVTLHQSGSDSSGINSSALGTKQPKNVTGNDGGVGLHQSKRKNNVAMGLAESGPSIDLQHSVTGSSSDDVMGLQQSACSGEGASTQPEISVSPLSPPLNTPVASPPSISNLLELSLPSAVGGGLALATCSGTGLLEVPMQDSAAAVEPSFVGLLPSEEGLQTSVTPPSSPLQILKEADNQWLNSEVADFSLSSFLGHLESPLKPATSAPNAEDTRLLSDVEAQLQCLMSENSIDYMAKFADLAAQIASSDSSNKK